MSTSPATPSKHGKGEQFPSPEVNSLKSKSTTLSEPSPASTYGETIGSSVPATPLERITQAGVNPSVHAAQLDPAIQSISNSPIDSREAKRLSSSTKLTGHVKFNDDTCSPSKAGRSGDIQHASQLSASPSQTHQSFRLAPAWRGSRDNQLAKSTVNNTEDPFISGDNGKLEISGHSSDALVFHPDRAGVTPTNNTAQAIFSPQACVFVANLSQSETDDQLEHSVTEAFQQFGNVYVKIRRDSRQMPFAFAQYTNVDDAQRAISMGRGMLINGRACRTEVARVNRSLYLSKISGGSINETEAREILKEQGPIETLWFPSPTEREMFGLPDGIFIRFAFFDDCRDAVAKFRDSDTYRLEQVKGSDESRTTPVRGGSAYTSPWRRDSPGRFMSPLATRRHADIRSIFVGNVPAHFTEEHLMGMFQMYGRVTNIEIIRKPSMANASGVNSFAFLEFEHPQAAAIAVQACPRVYQGLHIRVEHKDMGGRPATSFGGSPRRNGVDSPEFLAAFQRGVSIGMSHATQAQLFPATYYTQYPYYTSFGEGSAQPTMSGSDQKTVNVGGQSYGDGFANVVPSQYSVPPAPSRFNQFDIPQPFIPSLPAPYQWPVPTYDDRQQPMGNAAPEM